MKKERTVYVVGYSWPSSASTLRSISTFCP